MAKVKPSAKSIMVVARDFGPVSDQGRMMYDLARVLLKEGHTVGVFARKIAPRLIADPQLSVTRVRFRFPGHLAIMRKLKKIKYDLILSCADQQHIFLVASKISQAKKLKHLALIWTLENLISPQNSDDSNLRLIASGRCIAARLIASGFESKKITVIPAWLDRFVFRVEQVTNQAHSIQSEKELHKDETPKFRVLFWGPEGPHTPYQGLIDLATMVCETNPEIEFIFVGSSKVHERIAHIRSTRSLANVRLVPMPPPSKFKALMQSGDVHVVTLAASALGHVVPFGIFAAIMAERPIVFVGPDQSEAAIIVRDFKCGEVVPLFQSGAFMDAIMLYRHNPDAWHASHKASTHAAKSFSPEQSLKAIILRIYDMLS